MIQVTMLGCAATMPIPGRPLSAAALVCRGRAILLDCGEGTQLALHPSSVSPVRIDLIALSHYHGDHIFGLPGLIQTMGALNRTAPLTITGPAGLDEAMAPILRLADEQPFPIRLLTIPEEGLRLRELHHAWPQEALLTAFPTQHRDVSQGYCFQLGRARRFDAQKAQTMGIDRPLWRLLQRGETVEMGEKAFPAEDFLGPERRGLRVVFSGDTMPCPALEEASQAADLLIMDATYAEETHADKARLYGHSTYAQSAMLAARADVRRLWLTHFSAMIRDPQASLPLAQVHFPAAQCAEPGMTLTLAFDDRD